MKLYMHWDMEGTSGLFTRGQVWFWEEGVRPAMAEEGRRLLMADVNSATAAALQAGADRVIVCDTHHGGGNILIPEMLADPRVKARLAELGGAPMPMAPTDFGRLVAADTEKWAKVVKFAGIKPE